MNQQKQKKPVIAIPPQVGEAISFLNDDIFTTLKN